VPSPDDAAAALVSVNYPTGADGINYTAGSPAPAHLFFVGLPGMKVMGRTHYFGVGGSLTLGSTLNGLVQYNSNTTPGRVPDGASNTLLFMEYVGGYRDAGAGQPATGWAMASWGTGFNYLNFGLCPNSQAENQNCPANRDAPYRGLTWGTFGSLH